MTHGDGSEIDGAYGHDTDAASFVATSFHTTACSAQSILLQGFAQIPDLTVWYGPDTYMGRNLAQLFTSLAELPDKEVQKLHPQHTEASVKDLLPRLHYFEEGTCIVHHIFGGEVTELVRKAYGDAYLTAHFEVGPCSCCSLLSTAHCPLPMHCCLALSTVTGCYLDTCCSLTLVKSLVCLLQVSPNMTTLSAWIQW